MTTLTTIKAHIESVTPEQIGAAHLVLHKDGNFYQVESSQDCTVEYKVTYDKKGFHCDCKSGQRGFSNVKHASGVCWHVRAAIACSMEVKAAIAEQEAYQAQVRATAQPVGMYTTVDDATLARVMSAKPAHVKRVALPKSRPFQLMR